MVFLFAVVGFAIYVVVRASRQNQLESNFTPVPKLEPSEVEVTTEEPSEVSNPEPSVAEKWLKEKNLYDDTYETIVYDYLGLRNNMVEVRVVDVNLKKGHILVSIQFPIVDVKHIVTLDIENTSFYTDRPAVDPTIMADVFLSDSIVNLTPSYDSEKETPLDGVSWDLVARNLFLDLHMSETSYNRLFPSS